VTFLAQFQNRRLNNNRDPNHQIIMKKILDLQVLFALLLAAAPFAATAQTTFFSDSFTNGSTLNQPPATPTPTNTSYQSYIGTPGGLASISPGHLTMTNNSSSVVQEFVGLFTNSPIALSQVGDYMAISVVFVNSNNILSGSDTANSTINIGLFNSGGVAPNQGNITLNTGNTTGGTQGWVGYIGRIFWSGNANILTRPAQTANGTTSQNQDALFSNASSTQAFNSPAGTGLGNTVSAVTLTNGSTYTFELVIYLNTPSSLAITNTLYNGAGTGGSVIFTQTKTATNATFVTGGFNGMAVGWRNASATQPNAMDISSIQITGQSTVVTTPPTITSQPVPVTVATNGSGAFFVSASGFNVTYQWLRNGTNLIDGQNISGSTSSLLAISPAGTNDVLSGANGYYVIVSGAGGYSTNSVTNSLALTAATNLIWTDASSAIWDLNNSVNWQDNNSNPQVFNFGDPVTFNNIGAGGNVTLTGPYLSAASVTVNNTSGRPYVFGGSGSFAGPGQFIYSGSVQLTLNNANTYSGGTIISNASGLLLLENYGALGTGPVTIMNNAGGSSMEITLAGGASSGINGDVVVNDDFSIQFDGLGTYAGVIFGNLSGTAGKTLTLFPNPVNTSTNDRVRVYGINTTNNANLVLNSSNDVALISLAPYNASGSQTYNGVISGTGALIQRGSFVILNGANTYSGGTTPTTGTIGFGIDTVGAVTSGPIGTGPLYLAPEVPNLTGSGTVIASGGARMIANPIQYPSGTNNQLLIIGGTNALTFSGAYTLNGNDGLGTPTNRTVQVDNTNSSTTISGVISDLTNGVSAGYGFIKTGIGVLALNNTETYTGPTTVSRGTLQVNGQLNAASAVTVGTNATLAGTGTINGPVTVNAGGALAPGAASIGTLNINNNLTLSGNMKVRVMLDLLLFNFLSDEAVVSGALTNAGVGTVTVTNLGSALPTGASFTLFNKPLTNGAALTVIGAGMSWQNNLAVNGTITVLGPAVLVPTVSAHISSFSMVGGNVVIIGTNGQSGGTYYLLDSTNVAKPLSQWTTVATNIMNTNGASGAFTFTGTNVVTPGGQQFYILSNTNN
jgi:autotransporter-associated beta strand protein